MSNYMALKVHYDHRNDLPAHLKYSRKPTVQEYEKYIDLYSSGVGGNGFHECLNFSVSMSGDVKIYLPPTCLPSKDKINEDFLIFSFTYASDEECPSCIVGVHARVRFVSREGVFRGDVGEVPGQDHFFYFASAPAEYVTLFSNPIPYNCKDGVYTPEYRMWGNGLRYLDEAHARAIIDKAIKECEHVLLTDDAHLKIIHERQLNVLRNIYEYYFSGMDLEEDVIDVKSDKPFVNSVVFEKGNDKEIGFLGEEAVYERELAYAKKNGIDASAIEWVSQVVPHSPYDIKTVRKTKKGLVDHYVEVKSSSQGYGSNVYVSSNQVAFFKDNELDTSIVLVNFDRDRKVCSICDLSVSELFEKYDLYPIKYKLITKD